MIKSPKILFLVDDFSQGGAARVVETLIKGLSLDPCSRPGTSFRPLLACLDAVGEPGEDLRQQGVKVFYLRRRPGVDWGLIPRLAKLIRREDIALVHAHQYTAYFYGALAAILAGFVKVIFTEHGRHYPDRRKPLQVLLNKFILIPCTAAVTAVSKAVKQSLVTYEGIPPERIRTLLNGIEVERFRLAGDNLKQRARLGCKPAELLIGMVARLGQEKDHITLLQAMPLVCRQTPSARLLIIGDGPKRKELEQLASSLDLGDQVIFTGKRQDIPELLAMLDLVVLSSFYEGTSVSLLEAMAAGKAVIASRIGGNPQVVVEGESGLLFKPGDSRELAQKMVYLLADVSLRKQMGEQGRKRAEELFSGSQMVKKYEGLYHEILG